MALRSSQGRMTTFLCYKLQYTQFFQIHVLQHIIYTDYDNKGQAPRLVIITVFWYKIS